MTFTLAEQNLVISDVSTKIRLSMLSTAMVDALGGPAEFHGRFTFPLVTEMIPNANFSLEPGVWTDDTSMTLCLAQSISTCPNGFDEAHQLEAYSAWWNHGKLSAIDRCFDIGNTIQRALVIWATRQEDTRGLDNIKRTLKADAFGGNGSLMRVLPVGLAYWRDEATALSYGKRSSDTTHPNPLCEEACQVWTGVIVQIIKATDSGKKYTKLGLLKYLSTFPYTQSKLEEILSVPGHSPLPSDSELQTYFQSHHPLLQLIAQGEAQARKSDACALPPESVLPSSGYVLHTLVAALYCFFATTTFEDGAILAVNLGNDADTVGAVYAGLAGCWYAIADQGEDGLFWSPRVRRWRDALVRRDMVEATADSLVQFTGPGEH